MKISRCWQNNKRPLPSQRQRRGQKTANFVAAPRRPKCQEWAAMMGDTLIYWQDATGIFNCLMVGGGRLLAGGGWMGEPSQEAIENPAWLMGNWIGQDSYFQWDFVNCMLVHNSNRQRHMQMESLTKGRHWEFMCPVRIFWKHCNSSAARAGCFRESQLAGHKNAGSAREVMMSLIQEYLGDEVIPLASEIRMLGNPPLNKHSIRIQISVFFFSFCSNCPAVASVV